MSTGEIRAFRIVGPVGIDLETRDHDVPVVRFEGEAFLNGTDDLEFEAVDVGGGIVKLVVSGVLTVSDTDLATAVAAVKSHGSVLASHMDAINLRDAFARYVERQP